MTRIILALLLCLWAAPTVAGPEIFMMARRSACSSGTFTACTESGDTNNYLSNWSITGSTGTLYYAASYDYMGSGEWYVDIYSDSGRTASVASGVGYNGTITLTSTGGSCAISGSVDASGPSADVSEYYGTIQCN